MHTLPTPCINIKKRDFMGKKDILSAKEERRIGRDNFEKRGI